MAVVYYRHQFYIFSQKEQKMKNIICGLVLAVSVFFGTAPTVNAAEDLTILNTGSKTGGFSQQVLAYYTDMAKMKKDFGAVNLINPGNKCVAIKQLLPNMKGYVLMPWGSDHEAKQRIDGNCGASIDITKVPVVRFVEKFQYICKADANLDVTKNSGRIGYNKVVIALPKTISAINSSFGTSQKAVGYDGWGAAVIALFNGEVDYAIVSPPGNLQVEDKGGNCIPLSSAENSLFAKDTVNQNANLIASNIDAWLLFNATNDQALDIKSKLQKIHYECDTAMSKWQKGCDKDGTATQYSEFNINQSHFTRWENSVEWNKP